MNLSKKKQERENFHIFTDLSLMEYDRPIKRNPSQVISFEIISKKICRGEYSLSSSLNDDVDLDVNTYLSERESSVKVKEGYKYIDSNDILLINRSLNLTR